MTEILIAYAAGVVTIPVAMVIYYTVVGLIEVARGHPQRRDG